MSRKARHPSSLVQDLRASGLGRKGFSFPEQLLLGGDGAVELHICHASAGDVLGSRIGNTQGSQATGAYCFPISPGGSGGTASGLDLKLSTHRGPNRGIRPFRSMLEYLRFRYKCSLTKR